MWSHWSVNSSKHPAILLLHVVCPTSSPTVCPPVCRLDSEECLVWLCPRHQTLDFHYAHQTWIIENKLINKYLASGDNFLFLVLWWSWNFLLLLKVNWLRLRWERPLVYLRESCNDVMWCLWLGHTKEPTHLRPQQTQITNISAPRRQPDLVCLKISSSSLITRSSDEMSELTNNFYPSLLAF